MNITKVIQQLEKLQREAEEALIAVEGVQVSEDLDLDKPHNNRELTWSIIQQALKLIKHQVNCSLVQVKQAEKDELILNLQSEVAHASVLS